MEGARLIQRLKLRNLLSYGLEGVEVELLPLNVLIGPNASGKSNLIEAVGLLRSAPRDLTMAVRQGGGIDEWLWKGGDPNPVAMIGVTVQCPGSPVALRYELSLGSLGQRTVVVDESVEAGDAAGTEDREAYCFFRLLHGQPFVASRTDPTAPMGSGEGRAVAVMTPGWSRKLNQSILSQLRDPVQYPELTFLGNRFSSIALFRRWDMGASALPRRPQTTDLPEDFLLEDTSNLGLVLNDLEHAGAKALILEKLKLFCERAENVTTKIQGGTVQIFVHERGGKLIPATRLSDGTLRYLCLLAILCHPEPPPLICLEEPELGMHPDILPTIAELLVEASQRTQLIVTTHSDVLVSALTETPEAVVVCERDEGGSRLERLDPERLRKWLEEYSLGDLWLRGQIGGTRW